MAFGTDLNQGTALIVGASQGIGLGFVKQLLGDGRFQHVYGTYRNPASAQGLLDLADTKLTGLPMDVTDEDTIAAAVAKIQAHTPQLH
ncbi:MAG: SDR family NAD(P)-dependent oxidoreductase, partial [Leptolyngbyaceae cyanobacterium SM2_3_12]|nr:SDR family NAD(P)-dependent oxidoreductase [Leptolyngbyaceae cyanobacterium SM2_3_12]